MNIELFAASILRHDKNQTVAGSWNVRKLIIEGDYNGTINGFNFVGDMLHRGNLATAEVTGGKKIHSLQAYDVATQFVNGIDIVNWFVNAINLSETRVEQAIEGKVDLSQSTFYNDLQVLGTVNGMIINPKTVLTKSGEGQVIRGDLTIRTKTQRDIKQLFIENLFLSAGINDKNITEIYENSLKRSDQKIDCEKVVFEQPLITRSIETYHSIYGVNIRDFLDEHDANNQLMKFHNNLKNLNRVGFELRASARDVAVELSHFEDHQSLYGENIMQTVPFTIKSGAFVDYALAVHEKKENSQFETIRFYRWNREQNLFVEDASMLPLDYNINAYQVTRLHNVVQGGIDHLYIEIFDKTSKTFLQNLMLHDPNIRTFVSVLQSQSPSSAQFFTLNSGLGGCYGSCFPTLENLNIICGGVPSTVLRTGPIRMVSSQNGIIILLTDDHQLQIWHEQKIRQVLKVMNPQSFTSIRYNDRYFLAVSSDKVEKSIHHGSIEIFVSEHDNINFIHAQSINLENPFIVRFSVIPSGDLLLYILTKNPAKALSVHKYAGASDFEEIIGSSTIINNGRDLSVINIDGKREFIAVVSNEIFIIEAVVKAY